MAAVSPLPRVWVKRHRALVPPHSRAPQRAQLLTRPCKLRSPTVASYVTPFSPQIDEQPVRATSGSDHVREWVSSRRPTTTGGEGWVGWGGVGVGGALVEVGLGFAEVVLHPPEPRRVVDQRLPAPARLVPARQHAPGALSKDGNAGSTVSADGNWRLMPSSTSESTREASFRLPLW